MAPRGREGSLQQREPPQGPLAEWPVWWPVAVLAVLLAAAAGALLSARAPLTTPGSISGLLSSTAFTAAYEATYLHLRAVLDVTSLRDVDKRVFERIDTRSALSVLTYLDGEPWQPPSPIVDAAAARRALDAGATVVVNSAQGADRELANLAASTTQYLGIYADVNMYVTPPSSAGLTAHHDHMDSLIFQVAGRKRWLVCEPVGVGRTLPTRSTDVPGHPLYNRYNVSVLVAANPGGCNNLTMNPGDLLYLPRGTPHAPVTEEGAGSVHLTVGLLGDFIWEDYLKGLRIASLVDFDQHELQELVQCFDRRSLNMLVPHDALQAATLTRLGNSLSKGSSSSGISEDETANEVDVAERALAEALFAGFAELTSSGWKSHSRATSPSRVPAASTSAAAADCGAETKARRLRTTLLSCGVRCSLEVGKLMLRLQEGEVKRRGHEQEMLWGDHTLNT